MPKKSTTKRVAADKKAGKSASSQAGEYVREEIEAIREGKHGARSAKQAIAIGLSKARRAGVKLQAPAKGKASTATRKKAQQDLKKGASPRKKVSAKRSAAATKALKRESTKSASHTALSRQAKAAAKKRTPAERSAAAKKAAKTRAKKK